MDFVSCEKIARLVKTESDFPYASCSGSAPSTRESSRLPRKSAQLFCFFDRARPTAHIAACARAHLLPVSPPRSLPWSRGPPAGTRTASLPTPAARGAAERAEEAEGTRRCVRVANDSARFSLFRATRARARDRLGGTAARFLALTTPRRSPSPRVFLHAGLRRVRVRWQPEPGARQLRHALQRLAEERRPRRAHARGLAGRGQRRGQRRTPRRAQRGRRLERQDQLRQRGWGRGDERRRLRRRLGRGR